MIENLTRITISGPAKDFDRVIFQYLSRYTIDYETPPIQVENLSELMPLEQENPYTEVVELANSLLSYLDTNQPDLKRMDITAAKQLLFSLSTQVSKMIDSIDSIKQTIANQTQLLQHLKPILDCEPTLSSIEQLQHLNIRFGFLPILELKKLNQELQDSCHSVFYPCYTDHRYVYGFYFALFKDALSVDKFYEIHQFQRECIPKFYDETPHSIYKRIQNEIKEQNENLKQQTQTLLSILYAKRLDILSAYETVTYYEKIYEIHNYSTFSDEPNLNDRRFRLSGYLPTRDVSHLSLDLKLESSVHALYEVAETSDHKVPTKLRNPSFLRPFEEYTRLIGLPSYQEIDPTIFVAFSYGILFGLLFTDILQGVFLMTLGYLFYHYRKITDAGILCFAGIFSTLFWLINPLNQAIAILITLMVIGTILFIAAYLCNVIHRFRGYALFRPNWSSGIWYLILLVLALSTIFFAKIGLTQLLFHLIKPPQQYISYILLILGNLLICSIIGLLTTSLVLRLLYQFLLCFIYSGSGVEFKPHSQS